MNLVGKILTALIALFSLVFMSFAMAVYATHTNWRDKVMNPETGLQAQLKKEQDAKKDLQGQYDRLVAERDAERKAARDAAAALKTKADDLAKEIADAKKALADVQERERQAVAAMQATQSRTTSAVAERDELRKNLLEARKQRDEEFKKVVELTDNLHQTANELKTLQDKHRVVAQDLRKYKDLAAMQGLTGDIDGILQKVPPKVGGNVTKVSGTGLIEIDLGADAGLHKGHQMEVSREGAGGPTYLGRVEIVETEPDRAVCKILPEFQKGMIQKGDHVAAKQP
jgi:hypothetical protein